jgi:hypothetical protein
MPYLRPMDVVAVLTAALIAALLALVPAYVASSKGYSPALFWALGFLFFLPALLLTLLIPGRTEKGLVGVDNAIRSSVVARMLGGTEERLSPREISERAGVDDEQVARELSGLRDLAAAEPDATGRWGLTSMGLMAISGQRAEL